MYIYVGKHCMFYDQWNHVNHGFFYKYTPLPNLIVENDPRRKILPFLAWRERLQAIRGYFRHRHWRKVEPATWTGGKLFPPLAVAERPWSRHRGWRQVA
jgi:hypothetical protein